MKWPRRFVRWPDALGRVRARTARLTNALRQLAGWRDRLTRAPQEVGEAHGQLTKWRGMLTNASSQVATPPDEVANP